MRVNNKNLKNEIKLKIINKFGQNISLNKLYETILRRIVYDIKANLSETTTYFIKQIKRKLYMCCNIVIQYFYFIDLLLLHVFIADIKENCTEELVILNKLLQEHTQKLSFLTILVEEQSKLQKLLKQRIMSKVNYIYICKHYIHNI